MTLILELPDSKEAALKAKALAHGVSAEQYAAQLVERDLDQQVGAPAAADNRPISEVIAEIMANVPPEVMVQLPKDGAAEHDHYIYGWPKRYT
jgi:plasmid stability protein